MALNPTRKKKRDAKINHRFNDLCKKTTPGGKQLMSWEAMLEQLSDEFNLSEFTIERILRKKV